MNHQPSSGDSATPVSQKRLGRQDLLRLGGTAAASAAAFLVGRTTAPTPVVPLVDLSPTVKQMGNIDVAGAAQVGKLRTGADAIVPTHPIEVGDGLGGTLAYFDASGILFLPQADKTVITGGQVGVNGWSLNTGASDSYNNSNVAINLINAQANLAQGEPSIIWDVRLSGALNIYADGTPLPGYSSESVSAQRFALRFGRDPAPHDTPPGGGKFYFGVDNGTLRLYNSVHYENFGPPGAVSSLPILGINQAGQWILVTSNDVAPTAVVWAIQQGYPGNQQFQILNNGTILTAADVRLTNGGKLCLGQVGTLPPPSALYRGALVMVPGSPDVVYVCLLSADGVTYNWKPVVAE